MNSETRTLTVREVRDENARTITKLVEERREQLAKLLVGQDVDRFTTVALQVVMSDPGLLDADPLSVLSAIREAATHGLEPVGPLGDGAIIAYKEQGRPIAQFQPMYRGLMKLARRSGEVASIDAQVVYQNDDYLVELGTEPRIRHRPTPLGQERGQFVGAYAYARLRTGELVIVELNLADIDKIRQSSRSYRNAVSRGKLDSVWHKWPEPMMLKSAIKRLMKKLPLEPKASEALALDDRIESVETAEAPRPVREISEAKGRLLSKLGVGPVDGPGGPDTAESSNDAPVEEEAENGPDTPAEDDPDGHESPTDQELADEEIEALLAAEEKETLGLDR